MLLLLHRFVDDYNFHYVKKNLLLCETLVEEEEKNLRNFLKRISVRNFVRVKAILFLDFFKKKLRIIISI